MSDQIDVNQLAGALNNKMDLDGGNVIASSGPNFRNITKWSSNTSNCLTEVPQNIKLELNNGILTLKAGSKVYLPNGFEQDGTTPKFSELTIQNDINGTFSWGGNYTILVRYENGGIGGSPVGSCYSGSSAVGNNGNFWYDTTNNIFKGYQDGWYTIQNGSLPIAAIQCTSNVITSIKQVFNGFGYIGSTVFALPGVKGLIPNGRNEDGSLKNTQISVSSVLTTTFTATERLTNIALRQTEIQYHTFAYNEDENQNDAKNWMNAGSMTLTSGVVSNFTPKTVFHALDWNDSWCIPNYSKSVTASTTVGLVQQVAKDSEVRVIQTGSSNNYYMYYNIVPCDISGNEMTSYCLTSSGGYTGATGGNVMYLKARSYFKVKNWDNMTANSIIITPFYGG